MKPFIIFNSELIFTTNILDHIHGYKEVTKQCGEQETNGLKYKEGCETSEIPFKRKECYCRQSLCNSAFKVAQTSHMYILILILCLCFTHNAKIIL